MARIGLSGILKELKRQAFTPFSALASVNPLGASFLPPALAWGGLLGTAATIAGVGGGKRALTAVQAALRPVAKEVGSGIGKPAAPPSIGEQVARKASSPYRRYSQKTVKQVIGETAVRESFKAAKSGLKRTTTRRRKAAGVRRTRRAAPEQEATGTVVRAKRKRKRSSKPPTAKQIAARKRFAEQFGGRKRKAVKA